MNTINKYSQIVSVQKGSKTELKKTERFKSSVFKWKKAQFSNVWFSNGFSLGRFTHKEINFKYKK